MTGINPKRVTIVDGGFEKISGHEKHLPKREKRSKKMFLVFKKLVKMARL